MPTNQQVFQSARMYQNIRDMRKRLDKLREPYKVEFRKEEYVKSDFIEERKEINDSFSGIVFVGSFILMFIIYGILILIKERNEAFDEFLESQFGMGILVCLGAAPFVSYFAIKIWDKIRFKKIVDQHMNEYRAKIAANEALRRQADPAIDKLRAEIEAAEEQFERINVIHKDYLPYCGRICKYLETGRALNLSQAINVLEHDLQMGRIRSDVNRRLDDMAEAQYYSNAAAEEYARQASGYARQGAEYARQASEWAEREYYRSKYGD